MAASAQGIVTKLRKRKNRLVGGRPFSRGNLYQLLANPIYIGEIRHKRATFPGRHQPIIERAVWNDVQVKLSNNASPRRLEQNRGAPSLLTGLMFDETGDRLRPTHANKQGRRYRYYISGRLMHRIDADIRGWRLPAVMLEDVVIGALARWLRDPPRVTAALSDGATTAQKIETIVGRAESLACRLQGDDRADWQAALKTLVQRIELSTEQLVFHLLLRALLDDADHPAIDQPIEIIAPFRLRRRGVETKLVLTSKTEETRGPDPHLMHLLSRAHRWFDQLRTGTVPMVKTIAEREAVDRSDASRIIALAFLAPDITDAILNGRQPTALTAKQLLRHSPPPLAWPDQRRTLGFKP